MAHDITTRADGDNRMSNAFESFNPVADASIICDALRPDYGPYCKSTDRGIDDDDVTRAIECTANAKSRVRVYSRMGFVPNKYSYRCRIRYVEARRLESGAWRFVVGTTGAQRSHGNGSLIVVQ